MSSDRITRSVTVISSATMLSRVLGLVRDMVIGVLYGQATRDAFFVAFRIPNTLRALVAEGAVNTGFVPVFSDYLANRGREETHRLISIVAAGMLFLLGAITLLGMYLAPWIVRVVTLEFGPSNAKLALATDLTRIVFPFIFFIGLAALAMSVLYSLKHFAMPALAPALLNLSMIGCAYFLRNNFQTPVMALAVGVLVGGAAQLLLQLPPLLKRQVPLKLSFQFSHPGLRTIIRLLLPALIAQSVAQVNLLVDTMLAWYLGDGMVSSLYYANRLVQLPLGVFGISVSTALLPTMAEYASQAQTQKVKETLSYGLRLVFFVTVPATVGLIVLRRPIVRLLFERGQFDAAATDATAFALLFYALGLFAFAGVKVTTSTFYSMKETLLPVKVAAAAVAVNVVLNLILMHPLRQGGLALATAISFSVNLLLLLRFLGDRIQELPGREVLASFWRVATASLVMGGVCYLTLSALKSTGATGLSSELLQVAGPIAAGIAAFLLLARVLKVRELREIAGILRERPRTSPSDLE